MDALADPPCPDLPSAVVPVSLNAVTFQTTFMPSADVLPWHPDDDDPVPIAQNRECRVRRVSINTSALTSDLYPAADPYINPVFAPDDIPVYDSPTKVNFLDVGTMLDYWDHDAETVTVNAVAIDKDDHTAIRGQFDSGADATVTNLLTYLHSYRPYTRKFKCPVRLTGAVGSDDIYPLGEGFLSAKDSFICLHPILLVFLPSVVSILHTFPLHLLVLGISSKLPSTGAMVSVGKI